MKLLFTQLNVDQEVSEAKAYASARIAEGEKIRPVFTMYRDTTRCMSVYLPEAVDASMRQTSMRQLVYLPSVVDVSITRLVVDSQMSKASLGLPRESEDEMIDTLLIIFATADGAAMAPMPYILHPESRTPIWQHDQLKSAEDYDFLGAHPEMIAFCSMQFFMAQSSLPWDSYLKYLEQEGFEISYHHPFTAENIGFGLTPIS
jgi:hypothetical protein